MSTVPKGFQFRVPWEPTDQPLHDELHRELCEKHQLYGVEARAVAVRQDNDDVLFELLGKDAPAAFCGRASDLDWTSRPVPNLP